MGLLAITKKNKDARSKEVSAEDFPQIDANELRIADSAALRILDLLKSHSPGSLMRVGIIGGGCSGFSYHFAIEEQAKTNDLIFENQAARVCVDPKSLRVLGGSLLEWHEALGSNGFRIRNKKETKSCSCGKSFSL